VKKASLAGNVRKDEKSKPRMSFQKYFALQCNKTGFYLNKLAEPKNEAFMFIFETYCGRQPRHHSPTFELQVFFKDGNFRFK